MNKKGLETISNKKMDTHQKQTFSIETAAAMPIVHGRLPLTTQHYLQTYLLKVASSARVQTTDGKTIYIHVPISAKDSLVSHRMSNN